MFDVNLSRAECGDLNKPNHYLANSIIAGCIMRLIFVGLLIVIVVIPVGLIILAIWQ